VTLTHPTQEWSIGIFRGPSPLALAAPSAIRNPVLTKAEVTDLNAEFVADPFMIRTATGWAMFFEVFDSQADRGKIGLATSADAYTWNYQHIVLDEVFHLSYPYVFEDEGRFFMVPESTRANAVRLYVARQFPHRWDFFATLLEGPRFADSSLFRWQDRWWLFAETNTAVRHTTLRLFMAERLAGPWTEHPKSPIVPADGHIARPAGRVIIWEGVPVRFAQDCEPVYGTSVRAFAITTLTAEDYAERALPPDPILQGSGSGWNAGGMHHIDPHPLAEGEWVAAVDGWRAVSSTLCHR